MSITRQTYWEPCQTSTMDGFANIVNREKAFTIVTKCSIIDIWQGTENTSVRLMKISNCNLSKCNWTRTQNHLLRKRTLNHLAKLTYRVWIHSETRTWHGKNIQSNCKANVLAICTFRKKRIILTDIYRSNFYKTPVTLFYATVPAIEIYKYPA